MDIVGHGARIKDVLPAGTTLAFSIPEFCALHRISRPYFYKMLKTGLAPRTMMLGGRRLVSAEAAADWRREREASPA